MVKLLEADTASANTQALIFKKHIAEALEAMDMDEVDAMLSKIKAKKIKKESNKAKKNHNLKCRLQEGTKGNSSRYRVVLIQEGLGNFGNACYYSREALESAAPLFEGKKIYANHPSNSEEEDRPERSVRDILGNYENVDVVECDGRAELHADLVIPEGLAFDWARSMCDAALKFREKYSDQEFVGLSINAGGDGEEMDIDKVMSEAPEACKAKLQEAIDQGIDKVMFVTEISNAKSTDLVTEAGAGGKIIKLMEEAKVAKAKEAKVKAKENSDDGSGDDDASGDKDLFGKMMKKHLDDNEDSGIEEGDHAAIEGKFGACTEMGMKPEEAFGSALTAHKIDKSMAKKKEADGKAAKDSLAAASATQEATAAADLKKVEGAKESEAEVVRLSGRIAFLEKKVSDDNLAKHIDKCLAESKLPRTATKLFTEKAKTFKNEKDFDEKFAIFKEAYGADREENFVPNLEKQTFSESNGESGDFSDCVNE